MTAKEAIEQLDALNGDQELDHEIADQILLEWLRRNGQEKIAEAFEAARERVGFWYS